ncbi:MAG: DNA/RNA non-specific endonuclease [Halothiobacillaceae bacterium]
MRPRFPKRRGRRPRHAHQHLALMRGGIRLVRRHPVLALVLLLIGAAWYGVETQIARPAMVHAGLPVLDAEEIHFLRVLRNQAFMVGYSERLGNPLWVSYQVLPRPEQGSPAPRPGRFREDWRTIRCLTMFACVDHDSYTGSGFDRGHLAPNHVIASRYGARAQAQTFLMTNVSPQRPELNQGPWRAVEMLAADELSESHGAFWVITGPVFDARKRAYLPGIARIAIPDAFYKILLRETDDGPVALAFLMPQTVAQDAEPTDYLVTIREIERRTGLDFFHELPDDIENRLETTITTDAWALPATPTGKR